MSNPLFTKSNAEASNSVRLTREHIAMLKDPKQVDDYSSFNECGWFCIIAYKNSRRVFYAHCDSIEEFNRMYDPAKAMDAMYKGSGGSKDYFDQRYHEMLAGGYYG